MEKQKAVDVEKKKRSIKEDRYCQDCKWHSNKPSRCKEPQAPSLYVRRKDTCGLWAQ